MNGDDHICRSYDVLGRRRNGGYAEFVSVPAVNCLPYPERLPWEQAAAALLVFLTAWHMLVGRANLRPARTCSSWARAAASAARRSRSRGCSARA